MLERDLPPAEAGVGLEQPIVHLHGRALAAESEARGHRFSLVVHAFCHGSPHRARSRESDYLSPVVLSALDDNFLDSSRIFMAVSDTGEYVERRDVAISCCGLPVQTLNWGFLKPPWDDLAGRAAAVRSYFTGRKLPFQLTFRDAELRPAAKLAARRLAPEGGSVARDGARAAGVDSRAAGRPRDPRGRDARAARRLSRGRVPRLRLPGGRGANLPERAPDLTRPKCASSPGSSTAPWSPPRRWSRPAGSPGSTGSPRSKPHRGRGYGEALTWAAVAGGRERGCRIASLQASKLGRPVYARMGFAHVLDYEHLLAPEPGA